MKSVHKGQRMRRLIKLYMKEVEHDTTVLNSVSVRQCKCPGVRTKDIYES